MSTPLRWGGGDIVYKTSYLTTCQLTRSPFCVQLFPVTLVCVCAGASSSIQISVHIYHLSLF